MIDRHYGHLACDGREHAIKLLDTYQAAEARDVHHVDSLWTLNKPFDIQYTSRKAAEQAKS